MKNERTPYEQDVIDNAVEFTAVRGVRSNREVERFATLQEAIAFAPGDKRTMIYAVDANGLQAHVQNV